MQRCKNAKYPKAIDVLTSQGKFHINLGLERVQAFLGLIGNPQNNLNFIHVAGTNGKGSVCAMLSSILRSSGLRVGLFTSPHVFEYTERIKINDIEIDEEIFAQKLLAIVEIAEKNGIHLTEFEILTVLAFDYFSSQKVDLVILETGLGGRLDATNVIADNICSVITHIDLDHTERLGDTIEKIAFEKARIIKRNCPLVISSQNQGFDVIRRVAEEKNSELLFAEEGRNCPAGNSALKGVYQKENLALMLTVVKYLREIGFEISDGNINDGLKQVKHLCRFEYDKENNLLVDGAHNPDGARVLRESLEAEFPNQKFNFIFGCLNNKNYAEMMKNLFREKDNIYFYHFDNPNACSYEDLASVCEFGSKPFSQYKKDINTLTVVCGSFYMIKELLTKMGIK